MKNTKVELKDIELEKVNGGTNTDVGEEPDAYNVGAYLGMITSTSEQSQESNAYKVGIFPGLSGFP